MLSPPSSVPWDCTLIHNSWDITDTRIARAGETFRSLLRWQLNITCLIESVGARIPCMLRRSSDSRCMISVSRQTATMRGWGVAPQCGSIGVRGVCESSGGVVHKGKRKDVENDTVVVPTRCVTFCTREVCNT